MLSCTNDLGELLVPQTAHILFSEFLKFMFLNAMNVQAMQEGGLTAYRELEIEGESIMA